MPSITAQLIWGWFDATVASLNIRIKCDVEIVLIAIPRREKMTYGFTAKPETYAGYLALENRWGEIFEQGKRDNIYPILLEPGSTFDLEKEIENLATLVGVTFEEVKL